MRVLLLMLLLVFTLVHSHGNIHEEEARRAISSAVKERAALFRARYGNFTQANHTEEDEDTCSDFCKVRTGNGICELGCKTRGCLEEMGDCPSHPYLPCWEMNCQRDVCDGDCAMAGCDNNCEKGTHQQYLLFFSPFLPPSRILESFDKIENLIEAKTGLTLRLNMIWGEEKGKIEPFAKLWPIYPKQRDYTHSFSLFRVVDGAFDPQDHKTRRILQRMGGHKHVSRVTPMLLGPKQAEELQPFVGSYDDKREKLEMERKSSKE